MTEENPVTEVVEETHEVVPDPVTEVTDKPDEAIPPYCAQCKENEGVIAALSEQVNGLVAAGAEGTPLEEALPDDESPVKPPWTHRSIF